MWIRLDDGFASHPKLLRCDAEARWLYIAGLCHAARYLTDGHLLSTDAINLAARLKRPKVAIRQLVSAGLWEKVTDGFVVHDYLTYNPSRKQIEAQRAETRDRVQAWRDRTRSGNTVTSERVTPLQASRNAVTNSSPVHVPSSIREEGNNTRESEPSPDPRAEQLCKTMQELIGQRAKRPTITKGWLDEARRLLDIDNRPLDEALTLMRWAAEDAFWRPNVLSIPKFREKYDTLKLQRERARKTQPRAVRPPVVRPQPTTEEKLVPMPEWLRGRMSTTFAVPDGAA